MLQVETVEAYMFYLFENGKAESTYATSLDLDGYSKDFRKELLEKDYLEVLNYEQTLFEIKVMKHQSKNSWVVLVYDLSGILDCYRVDNSFDLATLLNAYSVQFELAPDGE